MTRLPPLASDKPSAATVAEVLAVLIAGDLERSIAGLGYPVGCGAAPHPDTCLQAARRIVERIKDQALFLLAEREIGKPLNPSVADTADRSAMPRDESR